MLKWCLITCLAERSWITDLTHVFFNITTQTHTVAMLPCLDTSKHNNSYYYSNSNYHGKVNYVKWCIFPWMKMQFDPLDMYNNKRCHKVPDTFHTKSSRLHHALCCRRSVLLPPPQHVVHNSWRDFHRLLTWYILLVSMNTIHTVRTYGNNTYCPYLWTWYIPSISMDMIHTVCMNRHDTYCPYL